MPRIGRVVAVGLPHHITQRGNYQKDVFFDNDDRNQYLEWIQEYSLKYGLSILVHCLMENHVHFIAVPNRENSLARTFNAAHMRYSQYFNKKLRQRGHLWQGRFYSCVLDEPHLIVAARYIERNPVRAGLVEKPWQWSWSSASAHIECNKSFMQLNDLFKLIDMACDSWKRYIDYKEDGNALEELRKYTLTGRPLGRPAFIEELEKLFGRRLSALPRGRPSKE